MRPLKVTLISQDFIPMQGGIASYLLSIWEKYLSQTQFEAIVPNEIYNRECVAPFTIHPTMFSPFNTGYERECCNREILNRLIHTQPDIILFGYLRSHPEIGIEYKKHNNKSRFGIFTHAKEIFLEHIPTTTQRNGSHKGYSRDESIVYRKILGDADYVFSVSTFTGELLKKQKIRDDYLLLPPTIRTDRSIDSTITREELNLSNNDNIILSVGRLIERKGHAKVLSVLPSVIQQVPNTKYIIIGDGPERKKLETMVDELKLQASVEFKGAVTDNEINNYYHTANMFVLPCGFIPPNDIEGFGIVFLEANMHKKPVIAGNYGGVSDAVVHNETGIFIDPDNKEELRDAILRLSLDKELQEKLGLCGYNRVINTFNHQPSNRLTDMFMEDISSSQLPHRSSRYLL